ncbi:hypothetical protein Bca4012_092759 [Brassica carinata]|uniref:Uncharacterized protein n=1 Tax=Brassica carinata TaxID=52824 RepID=A0A8X7PRN3_BRACI|nr:hypothetical protein Bca52824_075052 [Brassica carinata]
MSSRKGSSKRNSSSHSSLGDSSANEVIAPKEEFEVEDEAKDAYYKAFCGLPPPSQDIPIPKRPVRSPNAPLAPSMGFWFTRGTGIDGSYRMAPKKGMAIIQGHTSHPKAWFERFFFVRIDGESVEESYLHLIRREWNFTRVNMILPPTPADLFAKRDLLRSRPFFWNSFTVERIRSAVELHRSRAISQPLDGVASENVLGNLPLPEWNPGFSPGERSGTSEVPLPSDFFADLPPGFTTHKSLDEESRRKVVAEGSSLINEVYPLNFDLNYILFFLKFLRVAYLSLQSRGG